MAKWRRQTGHPEANRARTVLLGYNDGECTPFGTNKTGSSDVCRWHGSEKFETKNRPRLTKIMSKGNMCSTVPCNARTEVSKGKPKCDKADCTFIWGQWADPQQCGTTGTVKRMRKITQEAQCGGKRCSAPAYETREAKSPYDPKQDCVESWTPWSKCTGGRKRVRLGIEWLEMVPSKLC